ncbi:MAG: hypothetical protein ACM33T_07065 [Solirubrobacterales bacterium]
MAVIAMMLAATGARAQGPRVAAEWLGTETGSAGGVAITTDGGIVAAGRGAHGPRIVRFGSGLRVLEDWSIPGSDAWPKAVAAPPGAVAVVAGPADPVGREHGIAVWRLRLEHDGRLGQDWMRRFRRSALDGGTGAVALDDGGLVVVGWTGGRDGPNGGAWMLRLDPDGEPTWRRLALPVVADGVFEARAAARTEDGGLLVAAYGAPAAGVAGGAWVMHFDGDGKELSQVVVDEAADEQPLAVAALAEGWAVAGRIGPAEGTGASEAWLVRCSDAGRVLWERRWSGDGRLTALAPLPDGGLLAAGALGGELFLARIDPEGASVWERRFGRGAVNGLALRADGVAVAAGEKLVSGRTRMWVAEIAY